MARSIGQNARRIRPQEQSRNAWTKRVPATPAEPTAATPPRSRPAPGPDDPSFGSLVRAAACPLPESLLSAPVQQRGDPSRPSGGAADGPAQQS